MIPDEANLEDAEDIKMSQIPDDADDTDDEDSVKLMRDFEFDTDSDIREMNFDDIR